MKTPFLVIKNGPHCLDIKSYYGFSELGSLFGGGEYTLIAALMFQIGMNST